MNMLSGFIAMQQLQKVQQQMGTELCQALELLTSKLCYGFLPILRSRGASPREFAELREAKSLLSYLKYPDPTEYVRAEDIAWALGLVKRLYITEGYHMWLALFDQTAALLGIDLTREQPLPEDLGRRIDNELRLVVQKPKETAPAAAAMASAA